jgi:hypothetical protein
MGALNDAAIVISACWRPYYLKRVLDAWADVRGINEIRRFDVALGQSPRWDEAVKVIEDFSEKVTIPVNVQPDSGRIGPWKAIGDAITTVYQDEGVGFSIYGDEDTLVSDDFLELISWGRQEFENNKQVLILLGHSKCGGGWDGPDVKDDPSADPSLIQLIPYFSPWGWATWRDRWEETVHPTWDWDASTNTKGYDGGFDWNLAVRVIPNGNFLAAVPDASRTEHIGKEEGYFANEETYRWGLSQNFTQHRDPVEFRIREGE